MPLSSDLLRLGCKIAKAKKISAIPPLMPHTHPNNCYQGGKNSQTHGERNEKYYLLLIK